MPTAPHIEAHKNRWVARNFGSRRGLVKTLWYRLLSYLGRYRRFKEVDWSSVERLVFVCKGNICRSVYAEAVANQLGLDAISCGLDTIENAPANEEAIIVARELGADLQQHRSTPVMYLRLKRTDLLVAMEPWQAVFLEKHLYRKHQTTLLGLWSQPVLPHIQDPYGASQSYFKKCFCLIKDSVHELGKKIPAQS